MKIAISNNNGFVAEHFGRCTNYEIFEIENNQIKNKEILDNPGHEPFFLPKFLKEKNVNILISQGAGPRAIKLINELKMKIILVEKQENEIIITKFLNGELKECNNSCNH
jgi:predicted Fe-Mo cluster-binding NifX family protein